MQTTIVARVAEFLRDPEARKMIEKSAGTKVPSSSDKVMLSAEGRRKAEELYKMDSDWEKQRTERVQKVTEQVQNKSYRMSPELVDKIASRIVLLF